MAAELTSREIEVLKLVAGGLPNAQIAAELVVSVLTVQRHVANIYQKIGAESRSDLSLWAVENDVVPATAALLTPREIDLLRLISAGRNRQQIAETLAITIEVVNSALANLCFKIGARNRDEAVRWATENGIVPADEF
jgi:DNA-binding CsgD family transcriptional regulator